MAPLAREDSIMAADLRTFSPMAGVASAQGLDVSNYQGRFPWSQVKAGYPALAFGVYKMTEGLTFTDGDAQWNHDQLRAIGIYHGAYHFLHPNQSGAAQAQFFVAQHTKIGLTASDMLWLDNETPGSSPAQVASVAVAFMNELQVLCPHNPKGVYTGENFALQGNDAGLGRWPAWLAAYQPGAPVPPHPWTAWTFWQWGQRNGIDADAFNGTKAGLDAWMASFAPAATGPVQRSASGTESFAAVMAAHGTSVSDGLRLLVEHRPKAFGPLQLAYFDAGDLSAPMPPGMTYFTLS